MRLFHRARPTHAALVVTACCLLAAGCSGGERMPKIIDKTWDEGNKTYLVLLQDGKVTTTDTVEKKGDKKDSKVTKANMDKIKLGMKKSDVEDILGKGQTKAGAKVQGFAGA